jgi:lipopolysaccharide/colanic/teichoic acid biosynthesis glycosyltransferase
MPPVIDVRLSNRSRDRNDALRRLPRWKRAFDVVVAGVGLLIVSPLFAVIALLVKLTSPGPIFYRQERCGTGGQSFKIMKFRKMADSVKSGDRVTTSGDFRMTGLGRILERSKLDEIPQLINVLRGEMSIVGPRPEDPELASGYPEEFERILSTPPGIAGPNQIRFRNESELYPDDCVDRETYYVEKILPLKIPADLHYVRRRGFFSDLLILFEVLMVTGFGLLPLERVRRRPILLLHVVAIPFLIWASLTASFLLRFEFTIPATEVNSYFLLLAVLLPVQFITFLAANSHNVMARYFNVLDLRGILLTSLVGTGVGVLVSFFVAFPTHSRVVLLLHSFLLLIFGVLWMGLFRQFPSWLSRLRQDVIRRIRITAAYSVLGVVALGGAVMAVGVGSSPLLERPAMLVFTAMLVNGIAFFFLEGYAVLNRTIRFNHQFGLLKITVASSACLFGLGYMLGVVGGIPRSFVVLEMVFKYALGLVTKYTLARVHAAGPRDCRDGVPTVLVGTMEEVDAFFQLLTGTVNMNCIKGVLLVGQYHTGLSIHSVPILAEASRAFDVVEQLGIDRIIALDSEYDTMLRLAGVVTAIRVLDPEEEVERQRVELEKDQQIKGGVGKLHTVSDMAAPPNQRAPAVQGQATAGRPEARQ